MVQNGYSEDKSDEFPSQASLKNSNKESTSSSSVFSILKVTLLPFSDFNVVIIFKT